MFKTAAHVDLGGQDGQGKTHQESQQGNIVKTLLWNGQITHLTQHVSQRQLIGDFDRHETSPST